MQTTNVQQLAAISNPMRCESMKMSGLTVAARKSSSCGGAIHLALLYLKHFKAPIGGGHSNWLCVVNMVSFACFSFFHSWAHLGRPQRKGWQPQVSCAWQTQPGWGRLCCVVQIWLSLQRPTGTETGKWGRSGQWGRCVRDCRRRSFMTT